MKHLVLSKEDYEVYIDELVMVLDPRSSGPRVLLVTPPLVKPQFYTLLAIFLTKAGLCTYLPLNPLPCSPAAIVNFINKVARRYGIDYALTIGTAPPGASVKLIPIIFEGDSLPRHIASSRSPASLITAPPRPCVRFHELISEELVRGALRISGDVLSIGSLLAIRDHVASLLLGRG